jgi:hypothetical protein
MKNLLGIICLLCTGFGQLLILGVVLALVLPESFIPTLGTIFAVLLAIAFIVMVVNFVKNCKDFIKFL